MIVVDANILAKLLISPGDPRVEQNVYHKDQEWIGPPILRSEFRNLLATSLRKRSLDINAALFFMEEAEELLGENEFPVSSVGVLSLAARSGCTAYDCEYVALAMDLGIPLVTRDREILAAFPAVAVDPEAFLRR